MRMRAASWHSRSKLHSAHLTCTSFAKYIRKSTFCYRFIIGVGKDSVLFKDDPTTTIISTFSLDYIIVT